ncbi:MAG TPA: hypothetical protein VEX86_28490 [Longimicrobium sp.]|nr:hypothetical protein [Longimicrobium sp.]
MTSLDRVEISSTCSPDQSTARRYWWMSTRPPLRNGCASARASSLSGRFIARPQRHPARGGMVAQGEMRVEQYVRHGDHWMLSEIGEPDGVLRIETLGCEIPIDEIYARVEFDGDG